MSRPLDTIGSIKTKLGLLVAGSVVVSSLLALVGSAAEVPWLLVLPVTVGVALAVTQLLAAGMVAPLRAMTEVADRMARGDYSGRVHTQSSDEVGRLAASFNRMAHDLATVDRERRDLIATVSHELRTPLTAMTALLENLADDVVPADEDNLRRALAQAEMLRDLVADLLELSRLEAGVARLHHAPTPVRALLDTCVEQVVAGGRTARYDVSVPVDLVVEADPARLRQLLVNILDNAGRHTAPGTAVEVDAGGSDDGWWVQVTDAGPGVEPGDRERAFERFGTDPSGGGTGLGLAIARWVAGLHGGSLRFVDPPSGRGACLRLEVSPATKAPAATPAPAPRPTTQAPTAASSSLDALFGRFWPEDGARSSLRTVAAAGVAGLVAGAVLSFTAIGVSWTFVAVVCGAAALLTARSRREPWTLVCAGLALLLVLPMSLLDAVWVQLLCLVAAAGVFLCGTTAARTVTGYMVTGVAWPLASLRGLPWFGRSLRIAGAGSQVPALVRTVVWSLLGLAVFGTIFASANPVFSDWVDRLVPSLTFNDLVARAFLACFVFAVTLGAGYLALNPPDVDVLGRRRAPRLANRYEWLVPVLVVDGVFLAFIAAQARALVGGRSYIEETTGLTYADFVHQGFGQLTLATVLTLVVVWVAARRAGDTPTDRRWLLGSLGLLCSLSLLVVASALRGMAVYQDAYGFTTLRLFVDFFEGWLGFLLLATMIAGAAGLGRWLPRIALVSGAAALIALAALDPDAWVAERNLDRYETTGDLDLRYLQTLSADATPAIVERLPVDVSRCVLQGMPRNALAPETLEDARAWNLGRSRAHEALEDLGPVSTPTSDAEKCAGVWEVFGQ
ncbi:DUF4173 domain-containing protein [Nocardioides seonyuensis]|uniref:Signal transduction histidine-protein kinase/phosphatase MprB n=1 Tax=Nocardioides seonyuensis TaxID=2518371 RepID=A0A4V1BMN5_9ACTN|nr:DUF4153 domain-containing protein [Nocardioides seonyuensis]QBX56992.1 DUF4173 domain-containing protein [Nocardioides seonyuensis]